MLVEHGRIVAESMAKERVDEDVLTAARQQLGLERMDQIKFAVLEKSGGISVVPREGQR